MGSKSDLTLRLREKTMKRPLRSLLSIGILVSSIFCPVVGVKAATVGPSASPYCDLEFVGTVVPGDLERLRDAAEPFLSNEWAINGPESANRPLCLNSEGGSLVEAARIARYVYENAIATVLPENSGCLSACSWIFMMGSTGGAEAPRTRSRRMHFSARLGFHAPSLDLGSTESLSRVIVDQALSVMISATALILELGNSDIPGVGRFIEQDLIQLAFSSQGTENFFEINTVDHAGRWGIEVFGFGYPQRIDVASATHACNNLASWPSRLAIRPDAADAADFIFELIETNVQRNIDDASAQEILVRGRDAGYYRHECVVEKLIRSYAVDGVESNFIELYLSHEWNELELGRYCQDCERGESNYREQVPALAIFPPETRLHELPSAATTIQRSALASIRVLGGSAQAVDQRSETPAQFNRPDWCGAARSLTETTICRDAVLSRIDREINLGFEQMRGNESLRQIMRERLALRNLCEDDRECILRVTEETLSLLFEMRLSQMYYDSGRNLYSVQRCRLTSSIARITNVNEYANLRRQPDFSAPVIRQVPLGEGVRPLRFDNVTVIGQERDRQSCINACQAFGRNAEDRTARDRAQQCIQDNMIWYEVTDARGNRGWVSRRYLEEVR